MTRNRRFVVLAFLATSATTALLCVVYRLSPPQLLADGARVVAAPLMSALYNEDSADVAAIVRRYRHGNVSMRDDERRTPPFVYESPDAPHLRALRERYPLVQLANSSSSEYQSMLALAGWVGQQFDHGTDPVRGGDKACDPVALVEEGRQGRKYWCEIAARLMVHAAASVGWPARIVTASSDGRAWEHAVAELWSNEHAKWFVVDPDFNVVYESEGRPLSAFELMQNGASLKVSGRLHVRRIAPPKPSIPVGDPLNLYQYIHVDMRNDWCTRVLRRGSPAGGDLSTWWTARSDFRPVLTSRPRVDDQRRFDWDVNVVQLRVVGRAQTNAPNALVVSLESYSPYFKAFEYRLSGGAWTITYSPSVVVSEDGRPVKIDARVVTHGGWRGPTSSIRLPRITSTINEAHH